jgi:Holliday junction resolvasome RuvABC endonuclease subunit
VRTLNFDPGSAKIGACILEYSNNKINLIDSWQIPLVGRTMAERLFWQGQELEKIILKYHVSSDIKLHSIGLEETFINSDVVTNSKGKNVFRFTADSPLALSMSRGVVHYIAGKYGLEVFEYSNQSAKKALTGNATAGKQMVMRAAAERFGRKFNEDESCSIAVGMIHQLTILQNLKLDEKKKES